VTESIGARETSLFVGRDRDLSQLHADLEAAATGQGGLVLVAGEAGIGKTRLLEELARHAVDADFGVAGVTCRGGEGAPPFWLWARLVTDLVAGEDPGDAGLHSLLGDDGERRAPASVADAEAARWELFDAVWRLLDRTGRRRPLLLTLDDLHWADPASLRLLARLAPGLRRSSVAIVAAYRDTDATDALRGALAEIGSDARYVVLTGLERDALAALVNATAGAEPPARLVEALHEQTQGNPLFTREIVRLLVSQGRFERGRADDAGALPPTVRAVLERRLARLPAESHLLLVTAAVAGTEYRIDLLAETTGRTRVAVLALLGEAIGAGLVAETPEHVGWYQFAHPLVRQVLYDGLSLPRRVEEHRKVGDALAVLDAPTSEIAYHLVQAAPGGDVDRAVELSTSAGDDAARALAYEDAAGHYRQAIPLLPASDSRRTDLLLRAGEADVRSGDLLHAREAFLEAAGAARRLGDGQILARAALGLGSGAGGFEVAIGDQAQVDLLEEALDGLDAHDSTLRTWVTARLSVALTRVDEQHRRQLAEAAVAMARRVDDKRALAYALAAHCDVIAGPEYTDDRSAQSSDIILLARDAEDRELELLGRRLRLVAALERGDVAAVDAEIDSFERIVGTIRQPLYQWYVPLWRGMRALMQGDFARWERHLSEVVSIAEQTGSDNARMMLFTQRAAFTVFEDGDFTELASEFDQLMERHPDLLTYASVPAWVYARTGRDAQARAILDSLRTSELRGIPRDAEWLSSLFAAADAAVQLGHRDLAEVLYQGLRPFSGRVIVDGIGGACLGAVDLCLARLAAVANRGEVARRHFDDALAFHRAMGATLLVEATERYREADLGPAGAPVAALNAVFRREGDLWTLAYEEKVVGMKDAKGLRDLAALLAVPGQSIHVTELLGATEVNPVLAASGADAVLDRRAVEEYRQRLRDLEEEVDAAEVAHDLERAARGRLERDAIVTELESALGLGGRRRLLGDDSERARKAIRARIRLTLDRIEKEHPNLARHLRASVRTGTFCSYDPERPVTWQV
jgi:hypothetical protein